MDKANKERSRETGSFLRPLCLGLLGVVFGFALARGIPAGDGDHLSSPDDPVTSSPYALSDPEAPRVDGLVCEEFSVTTPAYLSHFSDETDAIAATIYPEWDAGSIYTGGDQICYQGRVYRAKWWTLGEQPGRSDVWEDTGETPSTVAPPERTPAPTETDEHQSIRSGSFRVVGYFPSWKPQAVASIRYDVLSHVIYAFAIPTAEGDLRPLENGETAASIIRTAHQRGVKVLLAVGGWSYNDTPLEGTFMQATATADKRSRLASAILDMCDTYGFDGVDMDWEHPRVDGSSSAQYSDLMLTLAAALHDRGKLLTSAVLSGATADGNIYYDAAAHSDAVLRAVDWIHVMAYDGGDGERHSPYQLAVRSAAYWHDSRGLPGDKVVLGVPFYARPSWASYADILQSDHDAWRTDHVTYNGMQVWYNGVDTIRAKTRYALEHLGGVMIWEIAQDAVGEHSLLTAIGKELDAQQTAPSPVAGFVDVPADAYYADAVAWAVEQGITNGITKTTFGSNGACTRAHMVTFLWRTAGSPEPTSTASPFIDVDQHSFYGKAVRWAVEQGIAKGTSADRFSPAQTCTRAQMATFLYRYAGSPIVRGTHSFADVPTDAFYADAVQWAASNKVTTGTSATTFSPHADCTRAQIVTFLYRYRTTDQG